MFNLGERVIFDRFVWATETTERENCRIIDKKGDSYYIENGRGTIKRWVKEHEIQKDIHRNTPFGAIL